MVAEELTREECERIFGQPVDEDLWAWIVKHGRQQEILDSRGKER